MVHLYHGELDAAIPQIYRSANYRESQAVNESPRFLVLTLTGATDRQVLPHLSVSQYS